MTQEALELYILPVNHGIRARRLFFEGPAGADGARRFSEATRDLDALGDEATSLEDFVAETVERFARAGFRQVAH